MMLSRSFKKLAAVFAVAVTAVGAFAQDAKTAYVPFLVNVDATVTVSQDTVSYSMTVKGGEEKTLAVPLGGTTSLLNPSGAQGRNNTPMLTSSRGNITLRLPPQSYNTAEITLYSVSGKRILRGKAAASEAANAISRRNVAAGVYMLSVKSTNGGAFTTRLTHSGGNMNINVAFGYENEQRLAKSAAAGDWEITVSADGYDDSAYTLNFPTGGTYMLQNITLIVTGNTITFSANGGSGTVASLRVPNGNSVTLPGGSGLSKSGHTFDGWNTESDGTGTNYDAGAPYTPAGNVTLYARWTYVEKGNDISNYKTVTIGTQVWMAENLEYNVANNTTDVCYNNSPDSCAKYGRLYNWETAMGGASSSSAVPSGVQGVCPVGWHLPSDAEWDVLMVAVGGVNDDNQYWQGAGTKLKSKTGWNSYSGVPAGTDEYGFSALPGGSGYSDGSFNFAGNSGSWWSATESHATDARVRGMYYYFESVGWYGNSKAILFSVRCVQDDGDTPPPPTTYTIMFNANGGSVSPTSAVTGTDGRLASLPTPTQSGYTFEGWYTATTGGTQVTTSTVFSGNTTIYVRWTLPPPTTYTIMFNANGGSVSPTSAATGTDGRLASLPTPTQSGYTFEGWYTATTGGTQVTTSTVFGENTTIYVRWTLPPPTTYTIMFNANGGSVSPTSAATGTDGRLASLPTPTQSGYTFDGWFTAAIGGDKVELTKVYTANTTIYARWTLNVYAVTFSSQGGSAVSSQNIEHGKKVTKPADPTRPNYTFGGWYKETACTNEWDFDSDVVTSAVTLYAKWTYVEKGNDISKYKTVKIGSQVWMAENLDYEVEGSKCYGNSADSCAKYGRLYNWETAKAACPVGWHLPSDAEWTTLTDYVGGSSTAGTKLKSPQYWQSYSGVPAGTDEYGFSALPGGDGYSGNFLDAGSYGYWWSATEYGAGSA